MKLRTLFVSALALTATLASAQPFDPSLFSEMKWRMLGPYRGGRTKSAVGVASRPGLFYIGVTNGGVYANMNESFTVLGEVRAIRKLLTEAAARLKPAAKKRKLLEAENSRVAAFDEAGFARLNQQMGQILEALQDVDDAPTSQVAATLEEKGKALSDLMAAWPRAQSAARQALR